MEQSLMSLSPEEQQTWQQLVAWLQTDDTAEGRAAAENKAMCLVFILGQSGASRDEQRASQSVLELVQQAIKLQPLNMEEWVKEWGSDDSTEDQRHVCAEKLARAVRGDEVKKVEALMPRPVEFKEPEWFSAHDKNNLSPPTAAGGSRVTPFLNAFEYWSELEPLLACAKTFVFITGWDLDHELEFPSGKSLFELLRSCLERKVTVKLAFYSDSIVPQTVGSPSVPGSPNVVKQLLSVFSRYGALFDAFLDYPASFCSHHQKSVIIDGRVAFVGGIDLARGRFENGSFDLLPANWPRSWWYNSEFKHEPKDANGKAYPRMPWRDVHCKLEGPAVQAVFENFEARWKARNNSVKAFKCDAPAVELSEDRVSISRSFPEDRSTLTAMVWAIKNAKRCIYIENQFFISASRGWGEPSYAKFALNPLTRYLAEAIARGVRVVIVLPMLADGGGLSDFKVRYILHYERMTLKPLFEAALKQSGDLRGQLAVLALARVKQHVKNMVYVHSKLLVVDDEFMIIGSANINERSLGYGRDTEIAVTCSSAAKVQAFRRKCVHQILGSYIELNEAGIRQLNQTAAENWDHYAKHEPFEHAVVQHPIRWDAEAKDAVIAPVPGVFEESESKDAGDLPYSASWMDVLA